MEEWVEKNEYAVSKVHVKDNKSLNFIQIGSDKDNGASLIICE